MFTSLKFYRVLDWLHFLGFTLLGILFAGPQDVLNPSRILIVTAGSAGVLGYAYSFNDIFDRDLQSSHVNPQNSKGSNRTKLLLLSVLPMLGSLILFSQSSPTVLVLSVLSFFLWTFYSYPIPRLRAIPMVCTFVNGVGLSALFLIGFAAVRPTSAGALLFFLALVLLMIPAQLIHEAAHWREDRSSGFSTTVVRFGTETAILAGAVALIGVVVLVVAMLGNGILNLLSAFSIATFASIFAGLLFLQQKPPNAAQFRTLRVKYRYGGIIAGVAVAVSLLL